MKHKLSFLQAGLLFSFTLCLSCGGAIDNSGYQEAIAVRTITINDGTTPMERNYVGDIGSEREINLSFILGGTLTDVLVHNGQHVKKGQLLAKVDATTATSLHDAAAATLRQAEDAYRRLEAVYKEGGISEVKWVEMQTNLEKARQAELSARKHLEDCSLYAPFDGVVSCGDHHVGQDMRPLEPFGRLIDMNRLRITFSVPEQEVALLPSGQHASATIPALDNTEISLTINDKSLVANPLGHTYKIHATINPPLPAILPDMVAKVKVALNSQGGIVIPSDCIQTMPEGIALWVVRNGQAHHTLVEVGDFVKGGVVIKGGLSAGDTIVVSGYQKLYSGAKVKIEN